MHGLLVDLVIAYGAGIVVVLLLHRLRVPTVVGFLAAGVLVGPHGFALVRDVDSVRALAEIGVVVLLFTIGVEMSLHRVLRTGAAILVAAGLQIGLTTAGVAVPAGMLATGWGSAVVLGILVAVSSTTVTLKVLGERGELESPHGRVAAGIALAQDLALVPVMVLLPLLGGSGGGSGGAVWTVVRAIVALGGTVVLARIVVPRALEAVVATRSRELFALAIVFLCLGTAWGAESLGVSLALGAFLGGLVVSESPYAQHALGELMPIRDALSGLFFMGVGMLLDVAGVVASPGTVLGAVAAILVGKALIAAAAVVIAGYPLRTAVLVGVALGQVGEFSFVLANEAQSRGLLSPSAAQLLVASAVLTMAASPFLYRWASPLADVLDRRFARLARGRRAPEPDVVPRRDHVIVVGFGLTGRHVVRALGDHGIAFSVIDMNPETVRREGFAGVPIRYGDAGHPDVLEKAGVADARLIVVAISDFPGTQRVVATARHMRSDLRIVVRARYLREVEAYRALGADDVVPDEVETSVEIFARVLKAYDLPSDAIERTVQAVRADTFAAVRSTSARAGLTQSRIHAVAALDLESHAVGPGSPADGRTLAELALRARHGVTVVGLRRGGDVVPDPGPATMLAAGDVVVLLGSPDRLAASAGVFRPGGGATGGEPAPKETT